MLRDRIVTQLSVLSLARFVPLMRLAFHNRLSVLFVASLYGSLIGGASACGSDATGPKRPMLTPAQAYWSLQLNQHAVMLALTAPVNTIQLNVRPLNADGIPLNSSGIVHYKTGNRDSVVRVDSTGLVTAQYASLADVTSFVIVSLTDSSQNVTHEDTCFIRVTATAPSSRLANFSIQPIDGDSAKRSFGFGGSYIYHVQPRATDSNNAEFTDFSTFFYSSNRNIAAIDKTTGNVIALNQGHVTFYAQTWSYGVSALDSLSFEFTESIGAVVTVFGKIPTGSSKPVLAFWPQTVTLGVGAFVSWDNPFFTDTVDVVFDDPKNVDSVYVNFLGFSTGRGNILPWVADTLGIGSDSIANRINKWYLDNFGSTCFSSSVWCRRRSRYFPVAGVYRYHSTKQPSGGTIIIK